MKSTQKSTKHSSLNTITNKCKRSRKPKAFSEASFVCLEFLACDACEKFEELCLSLAKARTREQISKDSQIRLSFVCLRGIEKRAAFESSTKISFRLRNPNRVDKCNRNKRRLKNSPKCQAPNKTDSSKKHISTQRYVCLYSIGVMPFSLSCGLSKLYHVMKSSICCINSVSFSGTNNSKDSLLR